MTDFDTLLAELERVLRSTRDLTPELRAELGTLQGDSALALAPAAGFLGAPAAQRLPSATASPRHIRVFNSRLILLKLRAETGDPRWSSKVLGEAFDWTLGVPNAETTDILQAEFELLAEWTDDVTDAQVALVHDLVVEAFARRRQDYEVQDFAWAIEPLQHAASLTIAQAMLLAQALPKQLAEEHRERLLAALKRSARHAEFVDLLSDA